MPKKIRLGILGGGGDSLIGVLHRVASFINDNYEIVGAVFNPDHEDSIAFAKEIDIPTNRIYKDFDTLVEEEMKLPEDERIQVCSILTPNFLHFPMAKKLLDHGFHVICEKPMTTTYEEAKILRDTLKKAGTVFAVTHTYTGYPMVRQMREMIKEGVIGKVHKVDAQYYQGWMNPIIHDKEKRGSVWRLDPKKAGISSCMGDIGVHAFNLIEFTTGLQVQSLLCDFNYVYDDNVMDMDGTALIRLDKNVKGVIRASQVATGEENNLTIAIYGQKGGLKWEQENPNYLYKLNDPEPLQVYKPGHQYNSALSLDGTKLPPGHPEGIFDAMANIYLGVAKAIRGEEYNSGEFPTMTDGVRGLNFIENTVASHKQGNIWVDMD
ncbi:MAG: Gfo/Idh/MocA family oxidoreductase [Muricauda sp.]|jgi:predicted dehydrogenase|uniref:Gfo/Idh/MocA family protein n=1 Tax=Flavobacteriaceae TaxID=49546 RepID=UPI0015C81C8D|nr:MULTISPECIES: Gfo/Idh/MocA family oxidoreductase [unclassified Allomuricauda]MBO6588172.1 Gfo/Idh/MocA family oxidoreductase [Allomuricauda sp.]MBO6617797.1 Gfo/Idh/MocA family oxidoreductase [Allomuricauda sp.]MBO6643192.1 Gfo/Idh/MocA family oxidoreductase [Allomuricauda sp.]MBO6746132.1 Gfo/Idh/MocA family oxidoreductase [Allomuricauda sp.]MBO6828788.1 Gfo/Idh/MocA family oxidoreductase [Allomuricauda sp.]